MIRLLLLLLLLVHTVFGVSNDIDKKISINKEVLKKTNKVKKKTNIKLMQLAKQINQAKKELNNLSIKIDKVELEIKKEFIQLKKLNKDVKVLNLKSNLILEQKDAIQKNILDTLITNHAANVALKLASKESINAIADSYIYEILLKQSKKDLEMLDNEYKDIIKKQKMHTAKIDKIETFIKKAQKNKSDFDKLNEKYYQSIKSSKEQHVKYQKALKKSIKKQVQLSSLLGNLNILKKKKIKKEQREQQESKKKLLARLIKEKNQKKIYKTQKKQQTTKKFNQEIEMNVRSIGSSYSGIKIAKYRGRKTIPPLKKYSILKKFGKSFDSVYKIKLFNDSITLKTNTTNSKVYSILSGKVVYSKKDNGLLENVVIVKHKNNLHTIYSHLDKIAPNIKKGKWLKKGSVVGRVDNTLVFQATKNNKYINPKELF